MSSTISNLVGALVAATVAATGAAVAPEMIETVTGQGEAAALVTETNMLALALGTEAFPPSTLTCVPGNGSPCASFSDYDFKLAGDHAYTLTWQATGGFVLVGSTADGSQSVVFDSENGGITDLSGTELPADDAAILGVTRPAASSSAPLQAAVASPYDVGPPTHSLLVAVPWRCHP